MREVIKEDELGKGTVSIEETRKKVEEGVK